MPPPTARFQIAFGEPTLDPDPVWTNMDTALRVNEYTIDRGRSYELDRCDTGRATVICSDVSGVLDPTHTAGIQPLLQARLAIWNPVASDWYTRFRGFVESYELEFDPSQKVNRVTVDLVDIYEILSTCEMYPGKFGESWLDVPTESRGNVYYPATTAGDEHGMQVRVNRILGEAGIPDAFKVVFSGNVSLRQTVYSPGESAMTAIQDAVDAEFPAVGNVYGDRLGRLAVHGRYARFDPLATEAATPGWDFHDWKVGDGAAVTASPTDTAHIRGFSLSRDLGKVINRATATPMGVSDSNREAAVVEDTASIAQYGIRPWSAENLLTKEGIRAGATPDLTALEETKTFAAYYVSNYKAPHNRVSSITFRSSKVGATGSAANWAFLSEVDINDRVAVRIGSPGGGGFTGKQFFVEGVHEVYRPAGPGLDDVTLSLDLSPDDYQAVNPW